MASKTINIPMCWKCLDGLFEHDYRETHTGISQSQHLVGCKAKKKITNYEKAVKLCPLTPKGSK